ncbi:MAG: hypothetical protein IPH03_02310 [Tetrasphaera sp.]|nr:hypothetical protein [Tetrasphaera sp.]
MTTVPPPDWAALYEKHRDAMYRVAARTLRGAGRAHEAEDAVMKAMVSLMERPPQGVQNWEAMLVKVTHRRALDLLKSTDIQHASGSQIADHDGAVPATVEDDVIEAVDRQRAAARNCQDLWIGVS